MSASPALRMVATQTGAYAAHGVNMVFIVVMMADHGLSSGQIGLVMGLTNLVRVVSSPCWGLFADAIARPRLAMTLGGLLGTLPMLILALSDLRGFGPTMALVLLFNIGASATLPLFDTLTWRSAAAGYFTFGQVRGIASITYIAGVVGGGFVVEQAGSASVVWMIALGNLASIALLPSLRSIRAAPPRTGFSLRPVLQSFDYRWMLLCSALIQGSHAAYYGFSTLLWKAALMPDRIIGLLWGEGVVAEVAVMLLLRHRIGRIDPWLLTGVGAALATLRWSFTALTTDPLLLALLQPLHAASFTLPYLAAIRIIGENTPPSHAATAQTLYGSIGISAPTGLIMAGVSWLYPSWGASVFGVMAVLSAIGAVLALSTRRYTTLAV